MTKYRTVLLGITLSVLACVLCWLHDWWWSYEYVTIGVEG